MVSWQAIFNKPLTAPPGSPADWIEEEPGTQSTGGWLRPTNLPVEPVEYRHLLPTLFFQGAPVDFVEPTDTIPVWNRDDRPVQPVEYRYLLPSLFFQGDPADFVEPSGADEESAWFQPTNQAALPTEYRHLLPGFFLQSEPSDFIEPTDTQPVWARDDRPVHPIEYRHLLPTLFYQGDPADFVEPTDDAQESAWFQPTNQPVLPVEYRYRLPTLFYQGEPTTFIEPPTGPDRVGGPFVVLATAHTRPIR